VEGASRCLRDCNPCVLFDCLHSVLISRSARKVEFARAHRHLKKHLTRSPED
jgi:hypothetical protein